MPSPSRPIALIAEDEAPLARSLREALARLWPELIVADVVGNGPAALLAVEQHAPDVLFLDIRMPGLSGLAVAERLLASDTPAPLVVFVTAYDAHALEAFDREAVDYLVKPVADERLAETVERLRRRLALAAGGPSAGALDELARALTLAGHLNRGGGGTPWLQFLRAGRGDTVRIVPVDEVTYLQAQDKYVSVYTRDGEEHLIRIALKDLAEQLDPSLFVQAHRSTIVNLRAVRSAERDFSGRVRLSLHGGSERSVVSRHHAHRFARM